MKNLSLAAIPVDHDMVVKKRLGNMPFPELVKALGLQAKDGLSVSTRHLIRLCEM
jgi:hypothetical protein